MVARKRWVWYPRLVKRRKEKLAVEAVKTSPNNVSMRGKRDIAGAASRGRKTSPLVVATKDTKAARTNVISDNAAAPDMKVRSVPSVTSPPGAPLYAKEYCPPYPTRWYQLGPPLFADRVRELLLARPLMAAHPSAVVMGASLADEEALSWLFPAVHNGEWFATPWEFIDHCRSIPHKLLCENAPLIPLMTFRKTQRRRSTPPPAAGITAGSLGDKEAEVEAVTHHPDRAASESLAEVRQAYYWWFVHLHTTLVRFGQHDWGAYLASKGNAVRLRHLDCVGRVWGCYRMFQTAVADAVARRLASSSQLVWQALPEATFTVACIVLEVYGRMSYEMLHLHSIGGLRVEDMARPSCMYGDQVMWVNDDPTTDAIAAAAMATAKQKSSLAGCERAAIIALAVHLAKTVTGVHYVEGNNGSCVDDDVAPATLRPGPFSAASGTEAAAGLFSHMCLPADGKDEEGQIMALVMWLCLAYTAEPTPTQAAVQPRTQTECGEQNHLHGSARMNICR
ncbi:hypothetical protein TraAM80_06577 [Trypanosoma rangeli]|uniref:Uncharacterized protein n=1 Tax=Trypanosoma rangeli TaxID=5698 RepID=A0A422N9F3_TRYRA|nr:uncharacterized protein TraAM80_06577 [Trypanosoma rangeli]RNF02118.1 hypothetical protein TraAM80_06577 [Trypanosoma rangeli]|eukprot:RNF02118.1 hypothetical protein TraAM80_06577 [Trypanosoma rangeli]